MTVIAGDFHFPQQDDAALAVLLETIRELRPARVILNGDLPDLLAVSKYPKDARSKYSWALRDEAVAMHAFLRELERVLPEDCSVVETEANHSGNGTGSRWWRYLSDRIPHLLQMDGAEERMGYQAWWYPEWSRLTLVDSVVLAGGLTSLIDKLSAAASIAGMGAYLGAMGYVSSKAGAASVQSSQATTAIYMCFAVAPALAMAAAIAIVSRYRLSEAQLRGT